MLPDAAFAVTIVLATATVFALCCMRIARAAFAEEPTRSDVRLAWYGGLAFALIVVGCLALSESVGNQVAAVFAVVFCLATLATGRVLARVWRAAEAEEARSLEELRALVDRYRASESSVEARCARAAREHDLTRREEDMLRLIVDGLTQPQIARELFVSRDTVKTHVRNLYRKMGVAGKAELVEAMGITEELAARD